MTGDFVIQVNLIFKKLYRQFLPFHNNRFRQRFLLTKFTFLALIKIISSNMLSEINYHCSLKFKDCITPVASIEVMA